MEIRFYNTLSHSVQPFAPVSPPQVFMYNCGPTVYDFAHIGNFRAFVFADVLRRFLELAGYQVQQVMNITDVGHMTDDSLADGGGQDKMAVAAQRLKEAKKAGKLPPGSVENPDDPYQVAQYFTQAFLADARALKLKIADEYPGHMPRATDHVGRMIQVILKLVESGHAYQAPDGCVYFDVQSFPEYGRLSGNTLDKLRGGAGGRVLEAHQAVKKHPADFLLWKPDPTHIMKWESPWGVGYPGWHIECSAMSSYVLGKLAGQESPLSIIDIHTGGEDNIFPHHECEIAQSVGATDEGLLHAQGDFRGFARFWMHTRFLMVEGQKMSKSRGTFYTVRDVLEGRATPGKRPVDPAVLRYELLKGHYRGNMNFTLQGLQDSAAAVQKLRDFAARLKVAPPPRTTWPLEHPMVAQFTQALADDLNISAALAAVFQWITQPVTDPAAAAAALAAVDQVLAVGLSPGAGADAGMDTDATAKCTALDAARQAKDFATADRLRRELQEAGYDVQTTKAGTVARKKLA